MQSMTLESTFSTHCAELLSLTVVPEMYRDDISGVICHHISIICKSVNSKEQGEESSGEELENRR
jgi:hypothetical protein